MDRIREYRYGQIAPARVDQYNYWTPEMETVVRHIKNQATGYTWIYEKIVAKAQKCENVLSILTGIISALIGTGGLISVFEYDGGWLGITTAIVGYVAAVLSILNATWNFGVIKAQGIVAQTDFSNLSGSITYQLALPPSHRVDAKQFVETALKEIDKLILNAPSIDGTIKSDYVKKFKNNPIYNPEGQDVTISQESFEYQRPPARPVQQPGQFPRPSSAGDMDPLDRMEYGIIPEEIRPDDISHPNVPDTQDHTELFAIISAYENSVTPNTTPDASPIDRS